ncbi:MAG: ParA family protein [Geobacteraceae bacterium]
MKKYPYVITISSEKGGVGKTTLATNLAIYLKALREDLPVSVVSLDNHFTVDKMFSIKGQKTTGDVCDLLLEAPGSTLLHTGQYGVDYIPSSMALDDLRDSIKGTMVLSRLLASSEIPGILIVDTRPELNIFTQNALYAADRVIIPVKDMPSLENCRNIFALFENKGLDKKSLSIIPCLIDARIKYQGPFKDHKSLLRAFAINRGYRCCDGYISKSPKVESLNTNPEGKIYPILTHARGTDVYSQYTQLGHEILAEYDSVQQPRSFHFAQWMITEEKRKNDEFQFRLSRLKDSCLLCGTSLAAESSRNKSFYYETSDGGACGFLEEHCGSELLLSCLYDAKPDLAENDPLLLMFQETARESIYAMRPFSNGQGPCVEVRRFTIDGSPVQKKVQPLCDIEGTDATHKKKGLHSFLSEALGEFPGKMRDAFLLIYPINPRRPEAILVEENYRRFAKMMHHLGQGSEKNSHFTNAET